MTGSQKHRDPRYPPYAFTELGVAMLSSVLRSARAVQVNIEIMWAYRELAADWQAGLEQHGHVVTHVSEVDAAIAALEAERYDLVTSDIPIRAASDRVEPKGGFSLPTRVSLNTRDGPKIIAVSGASPSLNLMKHAKCAEPIGLLRSRSRWKTFWKSWIKYWPLIPHSPIGGLSSRNLPSIDPCAANVPLVCLADS